VRPLKSEGNLLRTGWLLSIVLIFAAGEARAASKADLWARWQKHDATNRQKIDHGGWDRFLKRYVVTGDPSGIHRVRYQAVTPEDRKHLRDYLEAMQTVAVSRYNRVDQKAYWINLYNAATVDLVLSRFPVASIRDINISPGLLARGPWGAKLLSVEGEKVSLDDIEHRILRPIWKDNRLHYALNCASLGCPNLQPIAFTADNLESLLEKAAREFVNHPRGVSIQKGRLQVSSLYVWFQEDFGASPDGLMEHWHDFADPPLAEALGKYSGGLAHDYDWRLNGIEAKP